MPSPWHFLFTRSKLVWSAVSQEYSARRQALCAAECLGCLQKASKSTRIYSTFIQKTSASDQNTLHGGGCSAAYICMSWAIQVALADKWGFWVILLLLLPTSGISMWPEDLLSHCFEKGCKAVLGSLEKTRCCYRTRHDTKIWGCDSLSFARL